MGVINQRSHHWGAPSCITRQETQQPVNWYHSAENVKDRAKCCLNVGDLSG